MLSSYRNDGACLRRRSAFTLIELLVVIAIIALLLAILLPSLEAARRNARRGACAAHIKNIATSSRVYEADDPQGWGVPVHPMQFYQNTNSPTYIGAYEWGGKSGVGRQDFVPGSPPTGELSALGSKYGTQAGFGPTTRPMNAILYPSGFKDNRMPWDRIGALADTKLQLDLFRCPADDGPPRGAHCQDWVDNPDRPSFDHFGNSYAANVFMVHLSDGSSTMKSNSPYMRPISRIPTPARTLYYEENIGRWAWAVRREPCQIVQPGVDPGITKVIRGWHGADWTFNRAFADGHADYQKVIVEGTEDAGGYFQHYRPEHLDSYPAFGDIVDTTFDFYRCIIVRGPNWQKDTLPQATIETGLNYPGGVRPSYEDCVENG